MKSYTWHEIGETPIDAGVYAWYYRPEITDFDLRTVTDLVIELKSSAGDLAARDAIRAFLDERIFQYFREQPYTASLSGALKPRYKGGFEHVPTLSETMIARLADNPERLTTVRDVLDASAPGFASPVYIGMSSSLRRRLKKHKSLIERISEHRSLDTNEEDERDHSFAQEVCERRIPPSRLFVVTTIVDGPPSAYVDIENILNRIHYPLLGRN